MSFTQDPELHFDALKKLDDHSYRWAINYDVRVEQAPSVEYQGFRWHVCFRDSTSKTSPCDWVYWLDLTAHSQQEPSFVHSLPPRPSFKISILDGYNKLLWTASKEVSQPPVSKLVIAWQSILSLQLPARTIEILKCDKWKHFLNLQFHPDHSDEKVQVETSIYHLRTQLIERADLMESIKALQHDTEDSDVTLNVSGRPFRAHKVILKARSPVFRRMFQTDMQECRSGVVEITDCDPDTFEAYLQYVYSGDLDVVRAENAARLLYVSRKYGSEVLVRECHLVMEKNLTVANFCEFLLARLTDVEVEEFLEIATGFFAANFLQIGRSAEWRDFYRANPDQANELMLKAHEKSLARRKSGERSTK